jgi:hemerythrin-like domain-containing protein
MEPIGPLMHEHRLIERMVELLRQEIDRLESGGDPDVVFLCNAVDFITTYADACHHGKEEDILFTGLQQKDLAKQHRRILDELIEEHRYGRRLAAELKAAAQRLTGAEPAAKADIIEVMRKLVQFYPEHIRKEDKEFFFPALEYLFEKERQDMLREYDDFEKRLLHEKYDEQVASMEENRP